MTHTATLKVFVCPLGPHNDYALIAAVTLGDASITRQDAYLGNAINFDPSLFDVVRICHYLYLYRSSLSQLSSAANSVGGGSITVEAAAYDRARRVNNSIANNPEFFYETPRFLGATAESSFMLGMFASNQTADTSIPVTVDEANHFFGMHMFPDGFHRRQAPYDFPEIVPLTNTLIEMVGAQPGANNGVNNYVVNTMDDASVRLPAGSARQFVMIMLTPFSVLSLLPEAGRPDCSAVPQPHWGSQTSDQDQFEHILPVTRKLVLPATFPLRDVRKTKSV